MRTVWLSIVWLSIARLLTLVAAGQSAADAAPLQPGRVVEGRIGREETRRFRLALAAGEFACVKIGQVGVTLNVSLQRGSETLYERVFGWDGKTRTRPVPLFAEAPAEFVIAIAPAGASQAGQFLISLETQRPATDQDRRRAAAFATFQVAQQLRQKRTKESLQAALERFRQALADYEAAEDADGAAETLVTLGLIHDNLGETQQAIACYERALPFRKALGEAYAMAQLFNNLARAYANAGEKRRAADHYRQAVQTAEAANDPEAKATFLANLGYMLDILGEKQEALDLLEQAVALARQIGDAEREGDALNNQGLVYESLGLPARARERFERAVELYRRRDDRRSLAVALTNLARVHYKQRDFDKARAALEEALPLRRAVGDKRGEAYTLTGLGNVGVAQDKLEEGLRRFEQALALRRETGDRRGEGVTLASLGQTRQRMGDPRAAEAAFEQALALFQAVGDRNGEATMLYRLAVARRDADDLETARTRIEQAVAVAEAIRAKVAGQELRSAYFASVKDYYDLYIDILMRLHRRRPAAGFDAQALQVSERARARSLLDLLAEANVAIRRGVPPELQARERELLDRLAAAADRLTALLVRNAPEEQRRTLREDIADLSERLERVRREIRERSPRYAALTQPAPPTVAELQEQLDADTALLLYAIGDARSYAWVVTHDRLESFELLPRDAVNAAARLFWQTCQQPTLDPTADGEALARLILAPLGDALNRRRLVIAPDEGLHYVPFAALPDVRRPGRRLIERYEIVLIPSASALLAQRLRQGARPAPRGALAVVADPVFDLDDPRLGGRRTLSAPQERTREIGLKVSDARLEQAAQQVGLLPADDPEATIPRLPGTRVEAAAVASLLPRSKRLLVTDFEANRETLLAGEAVNHRILHIASHGLMDSERPELSGILLSRFDAAGRPREGVVGLADIFNLPLAAELVVLSACKTGLGAYARGEGLVGLTRGFMYAGATQVVVSLWSVNDQATARLMSGFYRPLLRDKRRPAEALRAAQLALLRENRHRHPFFWAAFQLHGDWR